MPFRTSPTSARAITAPNARSCAIWKEARRCPQNNRIPASGFVTLPSIGQEGARAGLGSGRNGRSLPVRHRFGSELSQGRAGDEVALEVEGVVDGSVDAEKALCGASRFEALHFALPPSHDLVRVLGAVVHPQPLLMSAGEAELPERSGIGAQLVGDRPLG